MQPVESTASDVPATIAPTESTKAKESLPAYRQVRPFVEHCLQGVRDWLLWGAAPMIYTLTGAAVALGAVGIVPLGLALLVTIALQAVKMRVDVIEARLTKQRQAEAFRELILNRVAACIQHSSQFKNKEEILALIEKVRKNQYAVEVCDDAARVKFVGSQGAIEHVLACSQGMRELQKLVGTIHTPQPATPLCTRLDPKISRGLLDQSVAHDLDKLLTVKSRVEIVREYLEKQGKLYIAYPKGGLEKRTPDQQEVYKEELLRYPNLLIDCVLDVTEIDSKMIGATYLVRDQNGNLYGFSIQSTQANDIKQQTEWGMWFGPIGDNPNSAVKDRVDAIFDYLKTVKGPDIRNDFNM